MIPIVLSPETAYASKENIKFPGTVAQATAARDAADARIEDVTAPNITVTIAAEAIVGDDG